MKNLKILLILLLMRSSIFSEIYDRILGIVNNEVITLFDLRDNYIRSRQELIKAGIVPPKNLISLTFDSLINQKIILQKAEEKDITASDSEVEDAIDNIKGSRRLSDKALKEELQRVGKSIEDFKKEIRNHILTEKVIAFEISSVIEEPTEEEILEFYNKNKKDMVSPPALVLKHILIYDKPNATLTERAKAKEKANMILGRALKGENFEKLAREFSEDEASAQLGGDLGKISKGEWLPEIEEFLFKFNKKGVYPQLLYSRWGWHIVKIENILPKKTLELNEVKLKIKEYLLSKKREENYKKWIENQKNISYIEVVLDNDEKYIYQNGRWKKKNGTDSLSNEKFFNLIEKLSL